MNLLALRKEKGLTQDQLAKKVGITRSLISQIETNISSPSIKTAQALAKALGCTIDELLAESEVKETEESNQEHMK